MKVEIVKIFLGITRSAVELKPTLKIKNEAEIENYESSLRIKFVCLKIIIEIMKITASIKVQRMKYKI